MDLAGLRGSSGSRLLESSESEYRFNLSSLRLTPFENFLKVQSLGENPSRGSMLGHYSEFAKEACISMEIEFQPYTSPTHGIFLIDSSVACPRSFQLYLTLLLRCFLVLGNID